MVYALSYPQRYCDTNVTSDNLAIIAQRGQDYAAGLCQPCAGGASNSGDMMAKSL